MQYHIYILLLKGPNSQALKALAEKGVWPHMSLRCTTPTDQRGRCYTTLINRVYIGDTSPCVCVCPLCTTTTTGRWLKRFKCCGPDGFSPTTTLKSQTGEKNVGSKRRNISRLSRVPFFAYQRDLFSVALWTSYEMHLYNAFKRGCTAVVGVDTLLNVVFEVDIVVEVEEDLRK